MEPVTRLPKSKGRRSAPAWAAATWLQFAVVLAAPTPTLAQAPKLEKLESTRATLEKWVETRRVISKERQDWALGREMLYSRIELLQREIASLREKITDIEKNISAADRKQAELEKEAGDLRTTTAELGGMVASLETRTGDLLRRLPDPIRETVRPLSQRIPGPHEKPDHKQPSLGDRFMSVVGILNEVNRFNYEITVVPEVRKLGDGTSAEVTALYVGIGQAYYVGGKGTIAGVGTSTPDGWSWRPENQAAQNVMLAIASYKSEEAAQFVLLPVRIK